MKVSTISLNENANQRKNFFIRYSNSFMSAINGNKEALEKTKNINPDNNAINKTMGIETLTIFPKEFVDGKMIITA